MKVHKIEKIEIVHPDTYFALVCRMQKLSKPFNGDINWDRVTCLKCLKMRKGK